MFKFGIDWSEQHHNLCIRNDKGAIVSQVEFKHTLEGFQRFDDERRKLGVPPSGCLVAIETAYNLLVDFLLDRGYLVYLTPPQATRGYRNRQRSTDAHTDDTDAALLSSILHTDLDSHRRLQPNSALTQQILAQVRLSDMARSPVGAATNRRVEAKPLRVVRMGFPPDVPPKTMDCRERRLNHTVWTRVPGSWPRQSPRPEGLTQPGGQGQPSL